MRSPRWSSSCGATPAPPPTPRTGRRDRPQPFGRPFPRTAHGEGPSMTPQASSPIDLEEVLARLSVTPRRAGVLGLCVLMAMAEGYDVQVMAHAAPLLARAWGLGPSEIGLLLTASVLGIVLG